MVHMIKYTKSCTNFRICRLQYAKHSYFRPDYVRTYQAKGPIQQAFILCYLRPPLSNLGIPKDNDPEVEAVTIFISLSSHKGISQIMNTSAYQMTYSQLANRICRSILCYGASSLVLTHVPI